MILYKCHILLPQNNSSYTILQYYKKIFFLNYGLFKCILRFVIYYQEGQAEKNSEIFEIFVIYSYILPAKLKIALLLYHSKILQK